MSDGLKIGLILAGAGAVAFLIYRRNRGPAAGVAPGIANNLGAAPGVAPTSSSASAGSSAKSIVTKAIGIGIAAPILVPIETTKIVAGGAVSAAKSVGHAIASIF